LNDNDVPYDGAVYVIDQSLNVSSSCRTPFLFRAQHDVDPALETDEDGESAGCGQPSRLKRDVVLQKQVRGWVRGDGAAARPTATAATAVESASLRMCYLLSSAGQ
jgi:hypothetical protein